MCLEILRCVCNRAPCLASTRLELVCHQLLSSSSPAESNTRTAHLYNIKRKHGGQTRTSNTLPPRLLFVRELRNLFCGWRRCRRKSRRMRKGTHLSKQRRLPHAEGLCVTASNLPVKTHHIGAMTHACGPGSNTLTAVLKRKCSQSVSISMVQERVSIMLEWCEHRRGGRADSLMIHVANSRSHHLKQDGPMETATTLLTNPNWVE